MRLVVPKNPVPASIPGNVKIQQESYDPCRCDDDKVDWRKLLKGI